MKPLEYYYTDNQVVEFDITEEVMVNATEMGKIFGKEPYEFLRLEQTKRFILKLGSAYPTFTPEGERIRGTAIYSGPGDLFESSETASRTGDGPVRDAESRSPESAFPAFETGAAPVSNAGKNPDFVRTRRGADDQGATWMHRLLALKFAAWLDPAFEIWIYQTIEAVLFANAKRTNEALKEKARIASRLAELRTTYADTPWFQEYQQLQKLERQLNVRVAKNNAAQLAIFQGE